MAIEDVLMEDHNILNLTTIQKPIRAGVLDFFINGYGSL